MALRELVVADVAALHLVLLEHREEVRDLFLSVRRRELEGEEDLRAVRVAVAVDELGGRAWVDEAVEGDEAGVRRLGNVSRVGRLMSVG